MKATIIRVVKGKDIIIRKEILSKLKHGSYLEISLNPVFIEENMAAEFPKGFDVYEP